jgi:DNA-binding CsgD family transcriptional regulator
MSSSSNAQIIPILICIQSLGAFVDRLDHIDRFIADIDTSHNLDDVFVALRQQMERLGFAWFTYWLLCPDKGPRRPLYLTSYPGEWVNRYIEQDYASEDIVGRQVVRVMRPFLWDSLARAPNLTKTQRLIFNESREFGLHSGASVPIHGPGKSKGTLSIASRLKEEDFCKLFLSKRHEIHLIATYAHERILTFERNSPSDMNINLSPRELEILTWTARGKTRWEISSILSISDDTVKRHLDHSCQKLNVCNKTHAVAIALQHALIWP